MTKQDFIIKFYSYAEKAGRELGVNPKYILAQWGLETGWSENWAHNLAGIGAFDDPSKRQTPYGYGYASYWDFTNAYVNLIKTSYKKAIGAQSMADFARGLKAGGYATDPAYVFKLVSVYNSISGVAPEPIPPESESSGSSLAAGGSALSSGILAGGAVILAIVLAAGVAMMVMGGMENA